MLEQTRLHNPFLRIKSRGLLLWAFFGLILVALTVGLIDISVKLEEKTRGDIYVGLLYFWIFYWAHRQCKKAGLSLSSFLQRGDRVKAATLVGQLASLLAFSIGSVLLTGYGLSYVWPALLDSETWKMASDMPDPKLQPIHFVLDTLSGVLVGPVVEETVFRGVLLNRWAAKWGTRTAILASGVAFAILHPFDIVGSFLFAICMAILYLKSRTLFIPVIVHGLYNALVVALSVSWPSGQEGDYMSAEAYRAARWTGLLLVAAGLPFIVLYIRRNWPERHVTLPHSSVTVSEPLFYEADEEESRTA